MEVKRKGILGKIKVYARAGSKGEQKGPEWLQEGISVEDLGEKGLTGLGSQPVDGVNVKCRWRETNQGVSSGA